ncbi:Hypothetical predicted protein [Podarcis lilfordi]|uniref:Uncharacterized protein n=1 Tax=Podarcis lilfordi TaxID=74358 RepID=A0AA35KFQ6_9SAUR|nr:Hypothetical predicted protein [Podarcis lilfordi]
MPDQAKDQAGKEEFGSARRSEKESDEEEAEAAAQEPPATFARDLASEERALRLRVVGAPCAPGLPRVNAGEPRGGRRDARHAKRSRLRRDPRPARARTVVTEVTQKDLDVGSRRRLDLEARCCC